MAMLDTALRDKREKRENPAPEVITGIVEAVNQSGSGIRVDGVWLNFSRHHPDVPRPQRGQRIAAQVDRSERGTWITAVEVLDGGAIHLPQRRGTGQPRTDAREIRRLACLKAAATFASGRAIAGQDITSQDVLKVAEAFERWVTRGGEPLA